LTRVCLVACLVAAVAIGACAKKRRGPLVVEGLTGGVEVFSDDFERDSPSDRWLSRSGRWDIRGGWLHCRGDHNEGIWLNVPLPERVRVEFDARSLSDDGDIKFEIFATEQRHQAGYILIMGGWKNTVTIIARLNEHGEDRVEKGLTVEKGRTYHFVAVRTDGTLSWFVDNELVAQYRDEDPIRGRYFGFNDWASDLYFDNLKVFAL